MPPGASLFPDWATVNKALTADDRHSAALYAEASRCPVPQQRDQRLSLGVREGEGFVR
jgi:hypothetical protein